MSNYHILSGRPDGNQLQVVFHIPIPDVVNAVGTGYREALVMSRGGDSTKSSVPTSLLGIDEQAMLDAGELYEHTWQFDTQPGMSLLNKRDLLDTMFIQFSSMIVTQIRARLEYYGYSRDVP